LVATSQLNYFEGCFKVCFTKDTQNITMPSYGLKARIKKIVKSKGAAMNAKIAVIPVDLDCHIYTQKAGIYTSCRADTVFNWKQGQTGPLTVFISKIEIF